MRSLTGFACPLCLFIDNIQKRAEKNKFLDVGVGALVHDLVDRGSF